MAVDLGARFSAGVAAGYESAAAEVEKITAERDAARAEAERLRLLVDAAFPASIRAAMEGWSQENSPIYERRMSHWFCRSCACTGDTGAPMEQITHNPLCKWKVTREFLDAATSEPNAAEGAQG